MVSTIYNAHQNTYKVQEPTNIFVWTSYFDYPKTQSIHHLFLHYRCKYLEHQYAQYPFSSDILANLALLKTYFYFIE